MHSSNRFPVKVYFQGGPVGYAEGGLHDEALAVKKAGRNGDSRLIHVNDEEFAEMVAQYGEPTINPETGMPEFFLGKIFKVFKKLAPLAAFAIPVVGPAIGSALGVGSTIGTALAGAGLGGITGGAKGALLGALTSGIGASGAGGKLGGTILGSGASQAAKNAVGQGLIGGALGAAAGQDPLTSMLSNAAQGYFFTPKGPVTASSAANPPIDNSLAVRQMEAAAAGSPSAVSLPASAQTSSMQSYLNQISAPNPMGATGTTLASAPSLYSTPAEMQPYLSANTTAPSTTEVAKPNFWNQKFLGLGIKNKYAIPAIIGAAALADATRKKDEGMPSREKFFGPEFSQSTLNAPGNFRLASVASGIAPESAAAEYAKRYFTNFASGGDVGSEGRSARGSFAVRGPGTGRSDEIPAMLSDGEYVIDAETVALLGDGSTKAGAKRLDDLRVKIRKHKGKKLAKGKFSHDAKAPEQYMAGGRI